MTMWRHAALRRYLGRMLFGTCGVLLLAAADASSVLVVRKDGSSFWAESARKDGDALVYIDNETRAERQIPLTELEQIIPRVRRGKPYKAEAVDKVITAIEGVIARHPQKLKKQLVPLLDEWRGVKEAGAGLADKIEAAIAGYEKSGRLVADFKQVDTSLGMLQYQDLSGAHTKRIEAERNRLRADVYQRNRQAFDELARGDSTTIADFRRLRDLGEALAGLKLEAADEKAIRAAVSRQRQATLSANARSAAAAFAEQKTLAAYLEGGAIYLDLRRQVAGNDRHRAEVDKRHGRLMSAAAAALKDYAFTRTGFPFTHAERKRMDRFYASETVQYTAIRGGVDERCFVLPRTVSANARLRGPLKLTVDLVFRADPPADTRLALEAALLGEDARFEAVRIPIAGSIKDAHLTTTVTFTHDHLDESYKTWQREHDPQPVLYLSVVCRPQNSDAETPWRALSHACGIRLAGG
jgi:hypothetical protein